VISILANKSSLGNISFSSPSFFEGKSAAWQLRSYVNAAISICDIDLDTYPDIILYEDSTSSLSILKNRQGEPRKSILCDTVDNAVLTSDITGTNYQWQICTDSIHFTNIIDNANYVGTNTATLHLNNIPSIWYGYQYRCIVDSQPNRKYSLQFLNTWTGASSILWNDPSNWSCGMIPDKNTDVIINSGTVVLNTNTSIRTLIVQPSASLIISSGYNLTITH